MNKIDKENFCKTMNILRQNEEFMNSLNDLLRDKNEGSGVYSSRLASEIIRILELIFDDKGEWISYWCWELNFGADFKDGDVIDEGNNVRLKTAQDLYDFLVKNMQR